MQRGFTKLFNTIVTSTIWQEDDKTRIVWITMLAIADAFGNVFAAIPGLASVANVSIESTEKAVTNLLAADPYSRTKDFEGRRIEEIDGGWHILNYGKYRKMMDEEERREYKAKWARESRRQKRTNIDTSGQTGTEGRRCGHRQRQSTEGEAEYRSKEEEIYCAFPRKVGKPNALKAIRSALSKTPFDVLLQKTKDFASTRNGDVSFCPHPATWFNQERYNDDPSTWVRDNNQPSKPKKPWDARPKAQFGDLYQT